jgi:hypothetical protein
MMDSIFFIIVKYQPLIVSKLYNILIKTLTRPQKSLVSTRKDL